MKRFPFLGYCALLFLGYCAVPNLGYSAEVSLTANPESGPAPLTTTLEWISVGADLCWRNETEVPLQGSEMVGGIITNTAFNISCESGKNWSRVTWRAPTQTTDDTLIPETGEGSLGGYTLQYDTSTTFTNPTTIRIEDKNTVEYFIENQSNATYYYRVNAFLVNGLTSAWSSTVTNTIAYAFAQDTAEVTVTDALGVTIETTAYRLVMRTNGYSLVAVGTIPLNTPCDMSQTLLGLNVVPTSEVTWLGTVRPIVVVARCSN